MGRSSELNNKTDQEVLQYVFDNGLTTKEISTDLSGQGVGLDAIKIEAQKLGGFAKFYSTINKGSKLIVVVPFEYKPALSKAS